MSLLTTLSSVRLVTALSLGAIALGLSAQGCAAQNANPVTASSALEPGVGATGLGRSLPDGASRSNARAVEARHVSDRSESLFRDHRYVHEACHRCGSTN